MSKERGSEYSGWMYSVFLCICMTLKTDTCFN